MKWFLIILTALPAFLQAQHTYIEQNSDLFHLARRMEISGKSDIHAAVNQYSSRLLFNEATDTFSSLGKIDQYLASKLILNYPEFWDAITTEDTLENLFIDESNTFYTFAEGNKSELQAIIQPKNPLLKYFYKNRTQFAQIKSKGFLLKINPVLFFGAGQDITQKDLIFENRRGITLSGHINDKIFFYSDILESQSAFPAYIQSYVRRFKALPGNGLYKTYNSIVLGDGAGYDYLNARAYINAKITEGVGVEFGNGRHFLGTGNRSLLLSDFANNYLYLKANTNIWKLHYQNIWAELIPISVIDNPGNTVIDRKYSATHYLSFKHRGLELGVFESVIFERDGRFDLQYLNPVILYRLVEYNLDSSDNVLVGANGKISFLKQFQLYGQLLLDEFLLRELILEPDGWWANKYGIQAGGRYIDAFGVKQLDLQFEYNRIRPFTYGHRSRANYAHANQSLAHPLGANLEEINFTIQYYINPKLKLSSENYFIRQGIDLDSTYIGENILTSSTERISDYGHSLLQGELSTTFLSMNKVSYEFFPNYFLDVNLSFRNQSANKESLNMDNLILSSAIRINFWEPKLAL